MTPVTITGMTGHDAGIIGHDQRNTHSMDKIKRTEGTQHLHHKSQTYCDAVRRKLGAHHRHIQLGLIAQGILQYLAVTYPKLVWNSGSSVKTVGEFWLGKFAKYMI